MNYVGHIFESLSCGICEVVEKNGSKYLVRFADGYEKWTTYASIRKGEIKNPYFQTFFGRGFIGEGLYKVSENGSVTKAYAIWAGMFYRCYGDFDVYSSYLSTEVNPEWYCFQDFACWYYTAVKEGCEDWQIDKDLLSCTSKEYSSTTCVMLPKEINQSLINMSKEKSGLLSNLPMGVRVKPSTGAYYFHYYDQNRKRLEKSSKDFSKISADWNALWVPSFKRIYEPYTELLDVRALTKLQELVLN